MIFTSTVARTAPWVLVIITLQSALYFDSLFNFFHLCWPSSCVFLFPVCALLFCCNFSESDDSSSVRLSVTLSLHPHGLQTFHQCPLLKHPHYGVLMLLLCRTKPLCQWNNPTGQQPLPGSCGAAGPGPKQPTWQPEPGLDSRTGNKPVCLLAATPKFSIHVDLFTQQTDFFLWGYLMRSATEVRHSVQKHVFSWTHLFTCSSW